MCQHTFCVSAPLVGAHPLWERTPVRDGSQSPPHLFTKPAILARLRFQGGMTMNQQMPHSHRLRLGRHSQAGQVYMVTVVTIGRRPWFEDFWAARVLVGHLKKEHALHRASTLAYVLMPDHLHWLMQLGEDVPLSQTVRSVKSLTTHRLGHPVWQRGYHDHAVRSDEDLQAMARYIVANPVRAGLVSSVADYPHWDAMWL